MKKFLKIAGVIIGIIVLGGVTFLGVLISKMPDQSEFSQLQVPRIVEKPNTNALMVSFDGDPNRVIEEAYGSLFKAYYSTGFVSKIFNPVPPIARYEFFDELLAKVTEGDLKSMDWKGFVAVPLSNDDLEFPEEAKSGSYPVSLSTLKYGTVAEIMHFGPYETEQPTIKKLLDFIEDNGYQIAGLHEEEYIRGPGTPFTDPEDYITIIRYQVKR